MSETSNAVGGPEELKTLLRERHEAEQVLAQALGHYPWYKDDPKNFPGATEADGVCTGPFTLIDVAREAAEWIKARGDLSGEIPVAAIKELRWAASASRADVAVAQIGEWHIQLSVPDLLSILAAAEREPGAEAGPATKELQHTRRLLEAMLPLIYGRPPHRKMWLVAKDRDETEKTWVLVGVAKAAAKEFGMRIDL